MRTRRVPWQFYWYETGRLLRFIWDHRKPEMLGAVIAIALVWLQWRCGAL